MARTDGETSFSISRYILFFILCLIAIVAGVWFLTASHRPNDIRDASVIDIETVDIRPATTPSAQ